MSEHTLGVHSETGILRQVIVCRPGLAQGNTAARAEAGTETRAEAGTRASTEAPSAQPG